MLQIQTNLMNPINDDGNVSQNCWFLDSKPDPLISEVTAANCASSINVTNTNVLNLMEPTDDVDGNVHVWQKRTWSRQRHKNILVRQERGYSHRRCPSRLGAVGTEPPRLTDLDLVDFGTFETSRLKLAQWSKARFWYRNWGNTRVCT